MRNSPIANPLLPEFFLDVGGTFTDCVARWPDGTTRRHKLLSSGVTKGLVGHDSTAQRLSDPARGNDPAGFWNGSEMTLLGPTGQVEQRRRVLDFDPQSASFQFTEPWNETPRACQPYELISGEDAPLLAIRHLLGLRRDQPLPRVTVRLGTTRGTNALLTRAGARTAWLTTAGLGDILAIGYQNRPRLFDLNIHKQVPLYSTVVEIAERVAVDGTVLQSPDPTRVHQQLLELKEQGIESLAICLLHAALHPRHEQLVEGIAQQIGFNEISVSHRVAPIPKLVPRGDTTLLNAYLNPVLRGYVARLQSALGESSLRLMTSSGGLVAAEHFVGKDSILSGPAGGVVGYSRVARMAGFTHAIGFDMGGTSTDVSRYEGQLEREYETEKAGVRIVAPMLAIQTVAAGGGSICHFDGTRLLVGPESAGAEPGPACYGRGGPLAVTDLNFYLGKILPEHFPFPLDRPAVARRLAELATRIEQATGKHYAERELCEALLQVANSNMLKAIQAITVAKGCDPRQYLLVAFGGAAGQHACALARELGTPQVLIHPDAGVLSALGIGMAEITRHGMRSVCEEYSLARVAALEAPFQELIQQATSALLDEGIAPDQITCQRSLDLRYRGLDAALNIAEPAPGATYFYAFATAHRQLYGYEHAGRALEIVALRVELQSHTGAISGPLPSATPREVTSARQVQASFGTGPIPTRVFDRDRLQPGDWFAGPAIVQDELATSVIDPGWRAEVLPRGELLLTDQGMPHRDTTSGVDLQSADPAQLEIFNHRFAGIAEQMGITLRNTASSVNVKERLDFSCAVFTAAGDLVVNAPHIPVHLGAMGETVRAVLMDNPAMRAGDVFVTNDPFRGGSHLPDVTVVTPVHGDDGVLLFFTASRAHHAEIGGIRPGSMPPFSQNLAEEGVLIGNFKLVAAGVADWDGLRQLLGSGPYPSRAVEDNLADVAAQIAANQQGSRALLELVARHGAARVLAYMRHIQDAAERKTRAALARLPRGRRVFTDHLDDGTPICLALTVHGDTATLDFTGSGPVLKNNLNANRAIVTSAVMYCLRCLLAEDIPLNQGVLAPVQLILPVGLLNPPLGPTPAETPAIVGGNVETSQRVVDVILGALGVAAASQGTMNNLVFGNQRFGYYETICGGAGATLTAPGADAVHTHMTNTRLTDPEVLEQRFPVRLWRFAIRQGSGGAGVFRGGHGVIRELEFLQPLEVSILSQRRGPYPPYGLAGGEPGALGENLLTRAGGQIETGQTETRQTETLPAQIQFSTQPGDRLTIATPGGGGAGSQSAAAD